MTGWNKATSNWLRRCVYERVPKSIATAASFFMSAIWHGYYPGYYLTFMSCALWNEVGKRWVLFQTKSPYLCCKLLVEAAL